MNKFFLMLLIFVIPYTVEAQAIFRGVTLQPRVSDMSILERSLKQREEREENAYAAYSELCEFIGEKYLQIHQDTETLQWFSININSYSKKILEEIESGDPGSAYRNAIRYKGLIATDSELSARIRVNKEYVKVHDYIMSRSDLSYEEKKEWETAYPYKFVPIMDDSGKVIGGRNWIEIGGKNNSPVIIP